MNNNKIIINAILEYEIEFDGFFIYRYNNVKDFLNNLTKEIETNGCEEFLDCYKIYFNNINNTNSTNKKRLALQNLISTLTDTLIIPKNTID